MLACPVCLGHMIVLPTQKAALCECSRCVFVDTPMNGPIWTLGRLGDRYSAALVNGEFVATIGDEAVREPCDRDQVTRDVLDGLILAPVLDS